MPIQCTLKFIQKSRDASKYLTKVNFLGQVTGFTQSFYQSDHVSFGVVNSITGYCRREQKNNNGVLS